MKLYAQSDTHYLLYIYDIMRNQLLDAKNQEYPDAMRETLNRSEETCLIKYLRPIYDAENGSGSGGWAKIIQRLPEVLNEENISVLRAVHGWRDHIARQEDESTHYVLPKHMLLNLTRIMPITPKDVINQCNPTPVLVKLYANELSKIIENAITSVRGNIFKAPKPQAVEIEMKVDEIQKPIQTRTIKHKIVVQITSVSQLFGNSLKNHKKPKPKIIFQQQTYPDQIIKEEEAVKVVKPNVLSFLKSPSQKSESESIPKVTPKRKFGFMDPEENQVSLKKQKETPEGFKAFDYENTEVEVVRGKKEKFFDPMAEFQDHKSKKVKNNTRRKAKSMSYK
jgi:ribonuclease D